MVSGQNNSQEIKHSLCLGLYYLVYQQNLWWFVVWYTHLYGYLQWSKTMIRYTIIKYCIWYYNITIVIWVYLRCKFIKSMVCHMFWILTSEESIELALDGINIPHGQWTLILVLSHKLIKDFNNPWLELFIIDKKIVLTVVKKQYP